MSIKKIDGSPITQEEIDEMTEFDAFKFIFFGSDYSVPIWVTLISIIFSTSLLYTAISNKYRAQEYTKTVEKTLNETAERHRANLEKLERVNRNTNRHIVKQKEREAIIRNSQLSAKAKIEMLDDPVAIIVVLNDYYNEKFGHLKKAKSVEDYEKNFHLPIFVRDPDAPPQNPV